MTNIHSHIMIFSDLCRLVNNRNQFTSYSEESLIELLPEITPDSKLFTWYSIACPKNDVFIPWTGNSIRLYDPQDITKNQVGYYEPQTWNGDWLVIGDIGGDPIIIIKSEKKTPVLMARHGTGEWNPLIIFEGIDEFIQILIIWQNIIIKRGGRNNIFDSDFNLLPEVMDEIKISFLELSSNVYFDNFLKFFWS